LSESFQSVLLAAISDLSQRILSVYIYTITVPLRPTCSPAICTVLYFTVSRLLPSVLKRFSRSFCTNSFATCYDLFPTFCSPSYNFQRQQKHNKPFHKSEPPSFCYEPIIRQCAVATS
jgi:hypothetical protein